MAWKSPSFAAQRCGADSVTVQLRDVASAGLRDDQYPFNYLGGAFNCTQNAGKCAWAELQYGDGSWVNATVAVAGGAVTLNEKHKHHPINPFPIHPSIHPSIYIP